MIFLALGQERLACLNWAAGRDWESVYKSTIHEPCHHNLRSTATKPVQLRPAQR